MTLLEKFFDQFFEIEEIQEAQEKIVLKDDVKTKEYTDVAGHWASENIKKFTQSGILNGYLRRRDACVRINTCRYEYLEK